METVKPWVYVRASLPGDSWLVLSHLRPEEVRELEACGTSSEECLRIGIASGTAQTLFIHNEAAGIFGVLIDEGTPVAWGIFTDVIDRYPVTFLRFCRRWMARRHGDLFNHVDARNVRAQKWFRWLGFAVGEPQALGVRGELMREVRREVHG